MALTPLSLRLSCCLSPSNWLSRRGPCAVLGVFNIVSFVLLSVLSDHVLASLIIWESFLLGSPLLYEVRLIQFDQKKKKNQGLLRLH